MLILMETLILLMQMMVWMEIWIFFQRIQNQKTQLIQNQKTQLIQNQKTQLINQTTAEREVSTAMDTNDMADDTGAKEVMVTVVTATEATNTEAANTEAMDDVMEAMEVMEATGDMEATDVMEATDDMENTEKDRKKQTLLEHLNISRNLVLNLMDYY